MSKTCTWANSASVRRGRARRATGITVFMISLLFSESEESHFGDTFGLALTGNDSRLGPASSHVSKTRTSCGSIVRSGESIQRVCKGHCCIQYTFNLCFL